MNSPSKTIGTRKSWLLGGLGAVVAMLTVPLVLGSQVSAAELIIGPEDVTGYGTAEGDNGERFFDGWHVSSTQNPDATVEESFLFGKCSITAVNAAGYSAWPSLLHGYAEGAAPSTVDAIRDIIYSTSMNLESGTAKFEFGLAEWLLDENGNRTGAPDVGVLQTEVKTPGKLTPQPEDNILLFFEGDVVQEVTLSEFF